MTRFAAINIAYIARKMGKDRSWLSQRLHGNIVNGKVAKFKPDERQHFLEVLSEVGQELQRELNEFRRGDE